MTDEWLDKAAELRYECEVAYYAYVVTDTKAAYRKLDEARAEFRAHLSLRAVGDGAEGWHAPGLGEVHSHDHRSMIYCSKVESHDVDGLEIPDDALAARVCKALATHPDREALILAKDALTEISAMYSHTWDRADDGSLVMFPISIPRFEAAHEKVLAARTAVLAAIAAQEGTA